MVVSVIGIFLFFFIFWKRLREDYVANQIFSTAFFVIFGIGITYTAARFYFFDWWFWALFAGALGGAVLGIFKYRMRIYEVIESAVIGLLPWLSLSLLAGAFINKSVFSYLASALIVILILLFLLIDTHYKTFTWYKSGKAGFSGLIVLSLLFLIRSGVAIAFPDMISFVGNREVLLSGIVAFILFLNLFNLARKSS